MTVLITGNDKNLFDVYQKIQPSLLTHRVHFLLDPQLNQETLFQSFTQNNNDKPLPTIYAQIEKIDPHQRKVILTNTGELTYQILIILPFKVPSVDISDEISNMKLYDSINQSEIEKLVTDIRYLLVVGDIPSELQKISTTAPHIKLIQSRPEDIITYHTFENQITSVSLVSRETIFVDYILVTSVKHIIPPLIHQTGLDLDRLELLDIFYLNDAMDSKIERLMHKLKPTEKYLCLKELALVSECELLENQQTDAFCHCSSLCRIHNLIPLASSHTYFTKKTEQKYVKHKDNEPCSLYYREFCTEDKLCSNKTYSRVQKAKWIASLRDALMWRNASNEIDLHCPKELSYYSVQGYIPDEKSLKNSLQWIIEKNHELLTNLNQKKNLKQRLFGNSWGKSDNCGLNILYFGTQAHHHSFINNKSRTGKVPINILTMGCAGIEYSLRYGSEHYAGFLEQEYIFQLPYLHGIILDKACVMPEVLQTLEERKIPVIDMSLVKTDEMNQQWDDFIHEIKIFSEINHALPISLPAEKYLMETPDDEDIAEFTSWVVIPGCCCLWTQFDFVKIISEFALQNYGIFATGCALSMMLRARFFPEIYPLNNTRNCFGHGSFSRIISIAQRENIKQKTVLMQGPAKIDAWLDALALKYFYRFDIQSNDQRINYSLDCLDALIN